MIYPLKFLRSAMQFKLTSKNSLKSVGEHIDRLKTS